MFECLVVGKEKSRGLEIPQMIQTLLSEFSDINHEEFLDGLPPMQDIQHCIDIVPNASVE